MAGVFGQGANQLGLLTINYENGIGNTEWFKVPKLQPFAIGFVTELLALTCTFYLEYKIGNIVEIHPYVNGGGDIAGNFAYPVDEFRFTFSGALNCQVRINMLIPGFKSRNVNVYGVDP